MKSRFLAAILMSLPALSFAGGLQSLDLPAAQTEGGKPLMQVLKARKSARELVGLRSEDLRAATGTQSFVGEAPVNLIYVADFAKLTAGPEETKILYSSADTGFVSQNVYLYCASEGLATVVRGSVDRPALAKAMGLRPEQRIVLAQSVGYPKK
jgi:nitroreductase